MTANGPDPDRCSARPDVTSGAPIAALATERRFALRLALSYAAVALIWIVASDAAVDALDGFTTLAATPQTIKGSLFVIVTAIGLYFVARRTFRTVYDASRREREASQLVSGFLTSIPVAGIAVSGADNVVLWNRQAEGLFGWRAAEVTGQPVPLRDGQGLDPLGDAIAAVRRGEVVGERQLRLLRRDGAPVDVGVWAARSGSDGGAALLMVDITERRRVEDALTRYQLLATHTRDIVLFIDESGTVLEANDAAARAHGYTRDDLIGSDLHSLRDGADPDLTRRLIEEALTSDVTFEATHRRRDGTTFPVEVSATGAEIAGHRLVLALIRDISRRQERDRQRETLIRADRLQALGQMASGVAHDLNQSLAVIAGYSELTRQALQDAAPDLGRVGDQLRLIEEAAVDGGQSLRRLLAFSRMGPEGEGEPVDITELLHHVARLTAPRWRDAAQAEGRTIDVEVQTEAGLVVVGWPSALREAATNLVFNAVDALPRGGRIALRGRRLNDQVVMTVTDTGDGIDPAIVSRIFDPFFTTKGELGTGLGLATVLATTRAHGGDITVRSTPGRGTTFELRLPEARGGEQRPAAGAAETPGAGAATRESGARVLAVDDEPRILQMLAMMLRQLGFRVDTAKSGHEALDVLARMPIDILVTDVGMGDGMNGWELVAAARERRPGLRCLLATGWAGEIDAASAEARGVDGVVGKPYRIADLRLAMSAVTGSTASAGTGPPASEPTCT